MKKYFTTWKWKVLLAVLGVLVLLMVYAGATGQLSSWPARVLGGLARPFQSVSAGISEFFSSIGDKYVFYDEIQQENQQLRERVSELEQKMVEFDRYKAENEQLKEFYNLQEKNPEWTLVPASVVGRDPIARYYSFTLDRGTLDGIAAGNPVVAGGGSLVGIVVEAGPNYAVVRTVLDPELSAAAMISRTRDSGLAGGDEKLSQEEKAAMIHMARDATAVVGDVVITTGLGGVFPKELRIGTVEELLPDASGKSLYAVVKPEEDVATLRSVMVITKY